MNHDTICDGRYNGGQKYHTLYQAQGACSGNPSCKAIVDYSCDGEEFWTCTGGIEDHWDASGIECTRTWKKFVAGINSNTMSSRDIYIYNL